MIYDSILGWSPSLAVHCAQGWRICMRTNMIPSGMQDGMKVQGGRPFDRSDTDAPYAYAC